MKRASKICELTMRQKLTLSLVYTTLNVLIALKSCGVYLIFSALFGVKAGLIIALTNYTLFSLLITWLW